MTSSKRVQFPQISMPIPKAQPRIVRRTVPRAILNDTCRRRLGHDLGHRAMVRVARASPPTHIPAIAIRLAAKPRAQSEMGGPGSHEFSRRVSKCQVAQYEGEKKGTERQKEGQEEPANGTLRFRPPPTQHRSPNRRIPSHPSHVAIARWARTNMVTPERSARNRTSSTIRLNSGPRAAPASRPVASLADIGRESLRADNSRQVRRSPDCIEEAFNIAVKVDAVIDRSRGAIGHFP